MGEPTPDTLRAPAGYTLVRLLGSGRTGSALLCRDVHDREVVVRRLTSNDPGDSDRLESEVRALAAASMHPCLVRTNRVFRDPDLGLCLEQDYCPGGSLQGLSPDPGDVAVGALRLGAALADLHARGVLHGDVRPADVLLDPDGQWCLADAGLVHAVGANIDPAFASRELRGWESPGPAADVYGLGATIHAALTGRPPLRASVPSSGAAAAPLPAATPPVLAALLFRMLADDPAERPALAEIDQVLRPVVPTERRNQIPPPLAARPVASPPTPRVAGLPDAVPPAAAQRRGLLIAATAAILFFAGAGAVIATDGGADKTPAELAAAPAAPAPASASAPAPASPTPTAAPTVKARKPAVRTPKDPVRPPKPARPQLRGTTGLASGPDVVNGIKPRQIIAFVYQGRLGVMWDMERVSERVRRFEIMSAKPDGTKALLGEDGPGDAAPRAVPQRTGYFFGPDVSLDRCVQVRVRLKNNTLVPDRRTVCPRELSPSELRYADDAWRQYLEYLATKPDRRSALGPAEISAGRPI